MTLGEHDHIVGAWAEAPSGPGWSNRLIWVCIHSQATGSHRVDCFQPSEQTRDMLTLFNVACAVSDDLIRWAQLAAEPARDKPKQARASRGEGRR